MSANLRSNSNRPVMDWDQVVANGGPPCFAVNTPRDTPNRYCGRAKRWEGHGEIHEYISLDDLLLSIAAAVDATEVLGDELLGEFMCHGVYRPADPANETNFAALDQGQKAMLREFFLLLNRLLQEE